VVDELILAKSVEEEDLPPRVVGGKVVEKNRDHWLHVEDNNNLYMKGSYRCMGLCIGIGTQDIIVTGRRQRRRI
jgi:hypothetical protein